jgi:hypothetical protein
VLLPERLAPFPEDAESLYQALGLALTRWQHIETALYLATFLLMKTDHNACSVAFFHIKSGENKLSFVDKLMSQSLKQHDRLTYWTPLKNELSDIIYFRNALAHFEVFFLTDDEFKKIAPPTQFRYALAPHHLDPSHGRGGNVKALSVETIRANADEMRKATYHLLYFLIDFIPFLDDQLTSLEPRLMTLLEGFRKNPRPPGFQHWRKEPPHSKAR